MTFTYAQQIILYSQAQGSQRFAHWLAQWVRVEGVVNGLPYGDAIVKSAKAIHNEKMRRALAALAN